MVNKKIFSKIKAVAFDLDGVIYLGENVMPFADKAIERLNELNVNYFFITNNSGKTREEIAGKLKRLGIDVSYKRIYSSAYLAGRYISEMNLIELPVVYVIGSDGLRKELLNNGIKLTVEEGTGNLLLVGYDVDFNYQKIVNGFKILLKGATFIACNREARFPIDGNHWMPACASMVAAIEASSGKVPDYIVGKPNTYMLEVLAADHNLEPDQILVVGDTPESDIMMANKFGCLSALFIPESEFEKSMLEHNYEYTPTICIKNHRDLIALLMEKSN